MRPVYWVWPLSGKLVIAETADQTTAESSVGTVDVGPAEGKRWILLWAALVIDTNVDNSDSAQIILRTTRTGIGGTPKLASSSSARDIFGNKCVWPNNVSDATTLQYCPLVLDGDTDKIRFRLSTTSTAGNRVWKGTYAYLEIHEGRV